MSFSKTGKEVICMSKKLEEKVTAQLVSQSDFCPSMCKVFVNNASLI